MAPCALGLDRWADWSRAPVLGRAFQGLGELLESRPGWRWQWGDWAEACMEMQGLGAGPLEAGPSSWSFRLQPGGDPPAPLFCFRGTATRVPRFQKSEGEEACKGRKWELKNRSVMVGGDGWLTLVMLRR